MIQTLAMLWWLAKAGQFSFLLLLYLLFELNKRNGIALNTFWWIAIAYSLIMTIYFAIRKWGITQIICNLSYLLAMGAIFIFRYEISMPEEYLTQNFQTFIIIFSLLFPALWYIIHECFYPKSSKTVYGQ